MTCKKLAAVFLTAILATGCYQPSRETPPEPAPSSLTHADTAEQALRTQAKAFASIARIAAGKTETWTANSECYDWVREQTEAATREAFARLVAAENERVPPAGQYDAKRLAEMLADEAEGFGRVGEK